MQVSALGWDRICQIGMATSKHDEPAISLSHMLDYRKSVIITDAQAWLENGVQASIIAGIRQGKVEDPLETARLPMGALSTAACHEANEGKHIGLVMIWSPETAAYGAHVKSRMDSGLCSLKTIDESSMRLSMVVSICRAACTMRQLWFGARVHRNE